MTSRAILSKSCARSSQTGSCCRPSIPAAPLAGRGVPGPIRPRGPLQCSIERHTARPRATPRTASKSCLPRDADGARNALRRATTAPARSQFALDGAVYVETIGYDAKGQRALVAMVRPDADALRVRPEDLPAASAALGALHPPVADIQSVGTRAAGLRLRRRPGGQRHADSRSRAGSGIPNTPLGRDALDRAFDYDPLYRLLAAGGRECDRPPACAAPDGSARCTDLTRTRAIARPTL